MCGRKAQWGDKGGAVSLGDNSVFLRAGSSGLPALRPYFSPQDPRLSSQRSAVKLFLCSYLAFHWFAISWWQQTFQPLYDGAVSMNALVKVFFFLTVPFFFSVNLCLKFSFIFYLFVNIFWSSHYIFCRQKANFLLPGPVNCVRPKINFLKLW